MSYRLRNDQLVFISSRIKTLKRLRRAIYDRLSPIPGLDTWIYEVKTASCVDQESEFLNAVDRCSIFIILTTGNQESGAVLKELERALQTRKNILAFVRKGSKKSQFDILLKDYNWTGKWRSWVAPEEVLALIVSSLGDIISDSISRYSFDSPELVPPLPPRSIVTEQYASPGLRLGFPEREDAKEAFRRATEHQLEGNLNEALKEYGISLALEPAADGTRLNMGLCTLMAGLPESARLIFQDLRVKYPDDEAVLNNLGLAYAEQGELDQAEQTLLLATDANPQSSACLTNLAGVRMQRNRFESAAQAFGRLTRLEPKNADAWAGLGTALFRLEQFVSAIEAYCEALELGATDALTKAWLGRAYMLRGDYEMAEKYLAEALAQSPELPEAVLSYGQLKLMSGHAAKALAVFANAQQLERAQDVAILGTAMSLEALGRVTEALSAYEVYLNRYEASFHVLLAAGILSFKEKRIEGATQYLERTRLTMPIDLQGSETEAQIYGMLGLVYMEGGKSDLGIAMHNEAVKLFPDNPGILYNRSCAFALVGRTDEAVTDLIKACRLDESYLSIAKDDSDLPTEVLVRAGVT